MMKFALALSIAKLLKALLKCFFAFFQLLSESLACMDVESQRFLVHNSQAYQTGGDECDVKASSDKVQRHGVAQWQRASDCLRALQTAEPGSPLPLVASRAARSGAECA